jgi:hypothetical protein
MLMHVRTIYLEPYCGFELYSFVNGTFMTSFDDSVIFCYSFRDEGAENLGLKRANFKHLHGLKDLEYLE